MNLSELPPEVQKILAKYRIMDPKSRDLVQVDLKKSRNAQGSVLGKGPIMAEDALKRIVAADITPNKEWLDWMLFQAGGGKEARRKSEQAIEQLKERFIDERVRGFRDGQGTYHDPVPETEAKTRWQQAETRFREVLMVGDQDMEEKLHVFGYHRNWPGAHRLYERVTGAVNKFLKLRKKAIAMNKFYEKEGQTDKMVNLDQKAYETIEAVEAANKKIERFYASREARQDIRYDTVYDDDFVRVIVPLTYAAAVEYGFQSWQWANKKSFEDRLEGSGQAWNDPWTRTTGQDKKVLVYVMFKVPMPSWVAYANNRFNRYSFNNVVLMLDADKMKNMNPETVPLYDEENKQHTNLSNMRQAIKDEATRVYNPDDEEFPMHRGGPVYKDVAEAEEVVRHLDASLDALKAWAKKFAPKSIVSDYRQGIDK